MASSRRLLLALLSLVLALALVEGAFRAVRLVVRGANSRSTVADPELGWVHNIHRPAVSRTNSCGEAVTTLPAPSPLLIRAPRTTTGRHVLFLGDSTTHAHEVSSGAAYYDIVETLGRGRLSVWAAGVGGYGNYQEALLLERVFDDVKPAIIVWQLDGNDISNNVDRLDASVLNNNIMVRPYLDPTTGSVERRSQALWPFRVSEAAQFALSRVIGLDRRFGLGLVDRVETWMGPSPSELPALNERGRQVLDRVVGEAVRRHPAARFAGFSFTEDTDEGYAAIFRRHGASFWPAVAARVRATGARTDCLPLDSHWNHTGNRIAGEILWQRLSEF